MRKRELSLAPASLSHTHTHTHTQPSLLSSSNVYCTASAVCDSSPSLFFAISRMDMSEWELPLTPSPFPFPLPSLVIAPPLRLTHARVTLRLERYVSVCTMPQLRSCDEREREKTRSATSVILFLSFRFPAFRNAAATERASFRPHIVRGITKYRGWLGTGSERREKPTASRHLLHLLHLHPCLHFGPLAPSAAAAATDGIGQRRFCLRESGEGEEESRVAVSLSFSPFPS